MAGKNTSKLNVDDEKKYCTSKNKVRFTVTADEDNIELFRLIARLKYRKEDSSEKINIMECAANEALTLFLEKNAEYVKKWIEEQDSNVLRSIISGPDKE